MINWNELSRIRIQKGLSETKLSLNIGRSHGYIHYVRTKNIDITCSDIQGICRELQLSSEECKAIFNI